MRLKWGLNNQERTKKVTIALYSCKKALGLRSGMSPRIVNWIYTAVVKPIQLYGVALWWTALHKQCILTALCISGALRTTPNEALNAILNLLSLDLAAWKGPNRQLFDWGTPGSGKPNSDSQAAIKSIYSINTNSRTIADCRRSLHEMASQFTISLICVPGHRDIVGNYIARVENGEEHIVARGTHT